MRENCGKLEVMDSEFLEEHCPSILKEFPDGSIHPWHRGAYAQGTLSLLGQSCIKTVLVGHVAPRNMATLVTGHWQRCHH